MEVLVYRNTQLNSVAPEPGYWCPKTIKNYIRVRHVEIGSRAWLAVPHCCCVIDNLHIWVSGHALGPTVSIKPYCANGLALIG
jgi:hypothetical protein